MNKFKEEPKWVNDYNSYKKPKRMKHKPPKILPIQGYTYRKTNQNDGLIVFDSDVKRHEKKQAKKRKIQKAKF